MENIRPEYRLERQNSQRFALYFYTSSRTGPDRGDSASVETNLGCPSRSVGEGEREITILATAAVMKSRERLADRTRRRIDRTTPPQLDDDVRHEEEQGRRGEQGARGSDGCGLHARRPGPASIEISKPRLRPFRGSPGSTNEDLNPPASTRPVGLRANVKLTDRQDNWCLTREPNRH